MRCALLVILLVLATGPAHAQHGLDGREQQPSRGTETTAAPSLYRGETGATGLTQWLAYESWPGHAQYDERLDHSISFWGAGIALADVFAQVHDQTDVTIGFYPPGDENERVRVNLYLNPDRPPTLRDLMAQLSWVLDCAFAYCPARESTPEYLLLSTSTRMGAEERIRAEQQARWGQIRQGAHDRGEQISAEVAEKLAELAEGLHLSREEAIARYRGVDDLLLLALLEPGRRRVVEFVLGLPDDELARLLAEGEIRLEWGQLSAPQQDAFKQHVEPTLAHAIEAGRIQASSPADWSPDDEPGFTLVLTGARHGFFILRGEIWSDGEGETLAAILRGQHMRLVPRGPHPEETVALLRALGETPDPAQIESLYEEARKARREQRRELFQQQRRDWLQARLSIRNVTSSRGKSLLESFRLPVSPETSYPLWAVQEAVAAATGLHIVSDCFSQPNRSISFTLELMGREEAEPLSGLLALKLWCLSAAEGNRFPRMGIDDVDAGWQWKDAGDFLGFRSLARDLWRAALLPKEILFQLDSGLAAHAQEALQSEPPRATAAVELNLAEACWLASSLGDAGLHHGGKVIYANPAEIRSSYAHSLREAVLRAVAANADAFRFLATLSDHQWEQMRGSGLRWPDDLSAEQRSMRLDYDTEPTLNAGAKATLRLKDLSPRSDEGPSPIPRVTRVGQLVVTIEATGGMTTDPAADYLPPGESHTIHLPRRLTVELIPPSRIEMREGAQSE